MAGIAKTVSENEALRKVFIPAYRLAARTVMFYPGPRVLATSVPKAGTHLVASLLKNFPQMMFSGRHSSLADWALPGTRSDVAGNVPELDWDRLEHALKTVNRGHFMTAHFPAVPELRELLRRLEYKTVFMIRDPRDVVISNAFYITRLKRHFLNERFNKDMSTLDERIMACITGLPATEASSGLISIGQRVTNYVGWKDDPDTHLCRFEDLVGANGGGSNDTQRREIEAIAAHINRGLSPGDVQRIAMKTWSQESSTFRKGVIGDWRNHFNDAHKDAFKRAAGQEIIDLGFEKDLDW